MAKPDWRIEGHYPKARNGAFPCIRTETRSKARPPKDQCNVVSICHIAKSHFSRLTWAA